MTTVTVYLTFTGTCKKAFDFYKTIFGGDYANLGRFKEMPAMEGMDVPASDAE